MDDQRVLFFAPEAATECEPAVRAAGGAPLVLAAPAVEPPTDQRGWMRSLSELALFNWLLLPTAEAAEALLDGIGAPPASTLRVATVGAAGEVLRREGREPEVEAQGLRALLTMIGGQVGRRERVMVPHGAHGGRRIGEWLTGMGADVVTVAAYELAVPTLDDEATAAVAQARVAVLAGVAEAEVLMAYRQAGVLPAGLAVAALTAGAAGAADAAEDCGLIAMPLPPDRLGPFLREALSYVGP